MLLRVSEWQEAEEELQHTDGMTVHEKLHQFRSVSCVGRGGRGLREPGLVLQEGGPQPMGFGHCPT